MSQKDRTHLMDLWAASLLPFGAKPPFANTEDLLSTIDSIKHGDAPWTSFTMCYTGPLPDGDVPMWMTQEYVIWTRNPQTLIHQMLDNEDFNGEFDLRPYHELNAEGKQQLTNFFSGDWAWQQAVSCTTHTIGAALVWS